MDSISNNSISMGSFINNKNILEHKRHEKIYHNKDEKNSIYIFKNFLNEKDFKQLQDILLECLSGRYKVNTEKSKFHNIHYNHSSIGWHPYFCPHWSFDLTDCDFFSSYMMSIIRGLYDWTHNLQAIRIYCSAQTATQYGNWHYDDNEPGRYTFCMYSTFNSILEKIEQDDNFNIYKKNLKNIESIFSDKEEPTNFIDKVNYNDNDGYFHIKVPNEPIKFIRTDNNSGILFDSRMLHLGDSPKYNSTVTRCVVAFKLFLPNYKQGKNNDK